MEIEKHIPLDSAIETGFYLSSTPIPINLKALEKDLRAFFHRPIDAAKTFSTIRRNDSRIMGVALNNTSFYPSESSAQWLKNETSIPNSLVDFVHPAFKAQLALELGAADPNTLEAFQLLEKSLTQFYRPDFDSVSTAFSDLLVRNVSRGTNAVYNEKKIITEQTVLQAFLTTLPGESRNAMEKITSVLADLHGLVARRHLIEQTKYLVDTPVPYTALLGHIGLPKAVYSQIDDLLQQSGLPKPVLEALIQGINKETIECYLEAHRKHIAHLIKAYGSQINYAMEELRGLSIEAAELDSFVLERMDPKQLLYDSKKEVDVPFSERFQQANSELVHSRKAQSIAKRRLEILQSLPIPPFPQAYDEEGMPVPEKIFHPVQHFPSGYHDSPDMVTPTTIDLVRNQLEKSKKAASLLTFQHPISETQANCIVHVIQPNSLESTQSIHLLFEILRLASASAVESIAFTTSLLVEVKAIQKREKIKKITLLPASMTGELVQDLEIYRDLCFVVHTQKNLAIMKKIIDTTKISLNSETDTLLKEYLYGMVAVITIEKPA
jgi:hypothetical protein